MMWLHSEMGKGDNSISVLTIHTVWRTYWEVLQVEKKNRLKAIYPDLHMK